MTTILTLAVLMAGLAAAALCRRQNRQPGELDVTSYWGS